MRILLVEDNPGDANLIREMLPESGGVNFEFECLPRLSAALGRLEGGGIDLVLLDLGLPDSDGLDGFRRVHDAAPNIPIVVLTGNADDKTATAAVREGAQDYLVKGQVSGGLLVRSILYAVERKRAEEQITVANERLQYLLSSTSAVIYSSKSSGNYGATFISSNVTQMIGYDPEEFIRDSNFWYEHVHPEDRMIVSEEVPRIFEKKLHSYEYRFKCRDGRYIWVRDEMRLVRDVNGNPLEIIGFWIDITERKRAEEALQGALSDWRTTFDAIGESICLIDNDGKITRHNRATELLLGKPSSEINGRFCWEAVHGLSAPLDDCPIVRMRKSLRRETLVIRAGDRWLEVTTDPLVDEGGSLRGGVHVVTDITARRMMEEEILRSQKLESLSILAGGIAHDFNNILTGILGNISYAGMLLDRDPPRAAERLAEAEQASLRAKELTQQLLTFSKGGAPIRSLRDIKSLIEEAARFAARGSTVCVRFEIARDLWAAEVDEGQINQVINNLVINAVQAMPEGGAITIRAGNIVLGKDENPLLKPGYYIRISIQDQGIGIPAHLLEKIFDPFFTTKQKGSGLGLSTVYSIIRNHNGNIMVDSTLGAGSAFTFLLPASPQAIPRAAETEGGIERFDARVLVMDDEPIVRDLAGEILRAMGCGVRCAMDGREMLKMYREAKDSGEPYDLVIMDLTIPGGMGGKEAIKELLALDPGAKAIVSSGYSNDPIMAEYRRHGFAAVLVKPYNIKEMCEALRKTLRGGDDAMGRIS